MDELNEFLETTCARCDKGTWQALSCVTNLYD